MAISGGCLCGKVRYQIAAEAPKATRICWCRVCQTLAAGSGTVNAVFASDAIRIEGETRDFRSVADSGTIMHRRFCSECGTQLFSEAEPRPHLIIVRVGTLDDTEIAKPSSIIWAGSAPSWACFDPDLPRVDGQPAPAK
jgi:hypothetical protein